MTPSYQQYGALHGNGKVRASAILSQDGRNDAAATWSKSEKSGGFCEGVLCQPTDRMNAAVPYGSRLQSLNVRSSRACVEADWLEGREALEDGCPRSHRRLNLPNAAHHFFG